MIFSETGEVVDGLHVIGVSQVPIYLLDGARPVLFDGGLTCAANNYIRDVVEVLGDREPSLLLLTHSHFDHCGAVSPLRDAFPGLEVGASAKAAEILTSPRAVQRIATLNEQAIDLALSLGADEIPRQRFRPFPVARILSDGDSIRLDGGVSVEVLATPGHTWDFLSYYIPERRILISSESVGFADADGYIFTEFLVDYDTYVASIERMRALEVEALCLGHFHVYTGEDARRFFDRSLAAAARFRSRVEELLDAERGDATRVVSRIKAEEYDPRPQPKQPEPAYLLNLRARVLHLARRDRT